MAFPCDSETALTDCLPSPCSRLSRAPTTTETPPLIQDITGLGGSPGFATPGAWIEVLMFKGESRDAVGGRLYPWLPWSLPESGYGRDVSIMGTPSRYWSTTRLAQHSQPAGWVSGPYRGFKRRLQGSGHPPRVLHHGISGSPSTTPRRRSGHFRPLGYCRPPIQSLATFAAPFYIRPDPDEDDYVFIGLSFALHDAHQSPPGTWTIMGQCSTGSPPGIETFTTLSSGYWMLNGFGTNPGES